jgi:hypothetical protein
MDCFASLAMTDLAQTKTPPAKQGRFEILPQMMG